MGPQLELSWLRGTIKDFMKIKAPDSRLDLLMTKVLYSEQ